MQSHDNPHIRKREENTRDETREEAHKLRRAEDGHKIDSVTVSEQTELIDKEKNENVDDGKNEEVDNSKIQQAKPTQTQEKHPVVKFEEEFLEKNGYEQLSHFKVTDEIRSHIGNASPVLKLNLNRDELNGYGLMLRHHLSAGTDNSLYICHFLKLYQKTISEIVAENHFKKMQPGRFIYDLILVKNDLDKWELNLRVIIKGQAGHPALLIGKEGSGRPECLVAAGEGYYFPHLGGIIMINDKTGEYHEYLKETGINPDPIFEIILSKYYAPEYKKDASGAKKDCFYPTQEDQRPLVEELIKRGLPYSLIPEDIVKPTIQKPTDILKRIPWESLSKELQAISEENQKKYDAYLEARQHPDNNNLPTTSPHRAHSVFPPAKKDEVSDTDSPKFTSAPSPGRLG